MSKFKPVVKLLEMTFEDYPGLEVTARSASIGQIKKAQEMSLNTKEENDEAFKFFERKIVGWNLTHPEVEDATEDGSCVLCGLREDDDLPPTVSGMQCLDLGIMSAIMFGWIQTVARVSIPKGLNSNVGATNGLGLLPTDGMESRTMELLEGMQLPMTLPMQS